METGSSSLPTFFAVTVASTASAVRLMVMTRSDLESQWPLKSPPWMMPVTSLPPGIVLHFDVIRFGFQDEAVHGVALGAGLPCRCCWREG